MTEPSDAQLIQAYLDNELDPATHQQVEGRLRQEPVLRAALEAETQFRARFRQRLRQTQAPDSLRAAVQATLTEPAAPPAGLASWLTTPRRVSPLLAAVYTVLLVGVILGGVALWSDQPPTEDHSSFRRLAGKHGVFYQTDPLLEITGDPDTIVAWFAGRTPFTVTVPTAAGWTLDGARLGEFHHAGTAHLLYSQSDMDRVSLILFIPRDNDFPASTAVERAGLTFYVGGDDERAAILWRTETVGYALIGDPTLTPADLLQLAVTLRQ